MGGGGLTENPRGHGKTREQLLAAARYAESTGKGVVFVVRSESFVGYAKGLAARVGISDATLRLMRFQTAAGRTDGLAREQVFVDHDAVESSPVYYTPAELRPYFGKGWSTRRVRRWLTRAGVLEDRHGTIVTTAERLAAAFPEIYRNIVMKEAP